MCMNEWILYKCIFVFKFLPSAFSSSRSENVLDRTTYAPKDKCPQIIQIIILFDWEMFSHQNSKPPTLAYYYIVREANKLYQRMAFGSNLYLLHVKLFTLIPTEYCTGRKSVKTKVNG